MNPNQMRVLWISISLIVLFGLFPPWTYQFDVTNNGFRLVQYGASPRFTFHFLFDAPRGEPLISPEDFKPQGLLTDADLNNNTLNILLAFKIRTSYSVDGTRLLIIWFSIALITSGLIYTLRDKRVVRATRSQDNVH